MSLSPSALRQTVEAAITAALGPASVPTPALPLLVSGLAWDKFPGADLPDREAAAFAVGVPDSAPLPDRQRRQAGGFPALTTVVVRFTRQVRADFHVPDQDAALDLEAAIVAAVSDASTADMQRPRFLGSTRRLDGDGTFYIGELRFSVLHVYPL